MLDRAFTLFFARVLLTEARRARENGHRAFAIWLQYRCMVNRSRARTPAARQGELFGQQVAA